MTFFVVSAILGLTPAVALRSIAPRAAVLRSRASAPLMLGEAAAAAALDSSVSAPFADSGVATSNPYVDPLLVFGGIFVSLGLAIGIIVVYVSFLEGGGGAAASSPMGLPGSPASEPPKDEKPRLPFLLRGANEIFASGLSNLATDSTGWMFGKPSALYSNEPKLAPVRAAPLLLYYYHTAILLYCYTAILL
jgi:hypothetical protein